MILSDLERQVVTGPFFWWMKSNCLQLNPAKTEVLWCMSTWCQHWQHICAASISGLWPRSLFVWHDECTGLLPSSEHAS